MLVMTVEFQQQIREVEVAQIVPLIPRGATILEIGAGAGWQARKLSERGFEVKAIDVAGSPYEGQRTCDVGIYDGKTIPFPDDSIDVVFTSHVLDHVPERTALQAEMKRVLRPGGFAVHIVPTVSWRVWTMVTHYPHRWKQMMALLGERLFAGNGRNLAVAQTVPPSKTASLLMGFLMNDLIIPRLGTRGDAFSECVLFSRKAREAYFRQTGWRIVSARPNRLYYSGNKVLGPILDLRTRHALSRVLGSASIAYVVEPLPEGPLPTSHAL
jgi:ubiquinone/menaquinone biosynthesis C-methylase UbiE